MKNFLQKFKYVFLGLSIAFAGTAFAVQISVPSAPAGGYTLISPSAGNYQASSTQTAYHGNYVATTTTATSTFAGNVLIGGAGAQNVGFNAWNGLEAVGNINNPYQVDIVNQSAGAQAMSAIFLGNDQYTNTGFTSTHYGGMACVSTKYNTPGANAVRPDGCAVFSAAGPFSFGSAASLASSTIFGQAGSGLDISFDFGWMGGNGNFIEGTSTTKTVNGVANYAFADKFAGAKTWISSSTIPQLMLEGADTDNLIFHREIGNKYYIGTSSPLLTAYATTSNPITTTDLLTGAFGIGTTSPGSALSVGDFLTNKGINISPTATSTWNVTNGGINLTGGCFAIAGTCVGGSGGGSGTVTSVTASTPNSTLTLGGTNPITTSGTISFDLNLTNANTWTAKQNFFANASSTALSADFAEFGGTATTTFTRAGFVGLSSTTPWALLSVNPSALGSTVPEFSIGSSTNTHLVVTGGGSVGINTASPPAGSGLVVFPTTFPYPATGLVQIGSTTIASGSANGTLIGANVPTGYSGNLLDLQKGGVSELLVTGAGALTVPGIITSSNTVISPVFRSGGATALTIQAGAAGTNTTVDVNAINFSNAFTTSFAPTSGSATNLYINGSAFNPASGSSDINWVQIVPNIAQTGTATGVSRGLYINPTVTTAYDFRSLETSTSTVVNLNQSTTTLQDVVFNQRRYASSTAVSSTNAYTVSIIGASIANTNATLSTTSALYIGPGAVNGGGTGTIAYGAIINAPTGGGTNTALQVYGTMFAPSSATSGANQTGYWCYDANGQFIRDTTVCLVSARKFKKDIQPLDVGLSDLLKLRPVSYYYKNSSFGANQQMGFIADEVASSSSRLNTMLVSYDNQGAVHGFNYETFTALITKSIQELYGQFQSLVARISGLEAKEKQQEKINADLSQKIDSLQAQINALKK